VVPTQSSTTHSRKSLISLTTSPSSMYGADLSAPHVRSSLTTGSPTAGCLDRHSLCGRIRQHALGGRRGVNPCASPAGMRTECAAGSSNWSIFSGSMVSIFVS
jgi:hypothetical protein